MAKDYLNYHRQFLIVWINYGANLMRAICDKSWSSESHEKSNNFSRAPGTPLYSSTLCTAGCNSDGRTPEARNAEAANTKAKTSSEKFQTHGTGIVTFPDGRVANIPKGMLTDQYGIAGAVASLRAAKNDPAIWALSMGIDLMSLKQQEPNKKDPFDDGASVFSTGSEKLWKGYPSRILNAAEKVPKVYEVSKNPAIRRQLLSKNLSNMGEDVGFYIFYNFPGEMLQITAAKVLYRKNWRFHKTIRLWLKWWGCKSFTEQSETSEKGYYDVFDPVNWQKGTRFLTIDYDELEGFPNVSLLLENGTFDETDSESDDDFMMDSDTDDDDDDDDSGNDLDDILDLHDRDLSDLAAPGYNRQTLRQIARGDRGNNGRRRRRRNMYPESGG